MSYRDTISGIGFIVKHKPRLPYGNKDRGKFIPQEKGRRAIFVPSFGTMETEEVDDIVATAQEQEDERLKQSVKTPIKENLEALVNVAHRAPKGKRAKAIEEALENKERWI